MTRVVRAGSSKGQKPFQKLELSLKELAKVKGRVGWFSSARYEDGTPVAMIAAIQELGAPGRSIPSRSFMRTTVIEKQPEWQDTAKAVSKQIVMGKMNAAQGMEVLCLKAEGDIAKKIASIISPPLSMITLMARKARQEGRTVTGKTIGEFARQLAEGPVDVSGVSQKPLIDTGYMLATLTSVVDDGK